MPITGTFRRNLSETSTPRNGVFYGVPVTTYTPSQTVEIYWKWYNDPSMEFEFFANGIVGGEIVVPFDHQYRSILFKQISRTATGQPSEDEFGSADSYLFTPAPSAAAPDTAIYATASVDLTRGEVVDLFEDGGILKARKADASDDTRQAEAFVDNDVLAGIVVQVHFSGKIMYELTGLTAGLPLYLSETAGAMTHVKTDTYSQRVGVALSTTTAVFEPHPMEVPSHFVTYNGEVVSYGDAVTYS